MVTSTSTTPARFRLSILFLASLAAVIILAFLLIGAVSAAPSASGQQWEYLRVQPSFVLLANDMPITDFDNLPDYLNHLGSEGWEMVSYGTYETGGGSLGYTVHEVLYFKRQIK